MFFDRIKLDDPVGALSVHLVHGVLGTLFIGLFSQKGVCLSTENGLLFGGGFGLLGKQAVGLSPSGRLSSLLLFFPGCSSRRLLEYGSAHRRKSRLGCRRARQPRISRLCYD
jgi:hypothetical protein